MLAHWTFESIFSKDSVVMNLSVHHLADLALTVPMPKSSYPQLEDALPKIHLALEEMPERPAVRRLKTPLSSYAHMPNDMQQQHPALMYAGEILGETQLDSAVAALDVSAAPYLRMVVFMGALIAFLWLGVAAIMIPNAAQEAELSFDPARVSQEFERSIIRALPVGESAPIAGAEEPSQALDAIPNRRVMVVTEGEREQLLDTLKSTPNDIQKSESIETYILNPSPIVKE
jgi:hypothetical protein